MNDKQLQEEILDTATELFRQKGLKFTMQDVAAEMHVAKKTIYKLYASKEDLLLDLVQTGFEQIQDAKREVLESDISLHDKIAAVLIAMPEKYRNLDFRRLKGIDEKYPKVARRISERLSSEWEPVIAILNEGIEKGVVHPVSIPILKQIVTASIDSFMYSDALQSSGISYQEALQEMVNIIMKGIWHDQTE